MSRQATARGSQRCYGIHVLIAGGRKGWRDQVSARIRQEGYYATTVESAVDALTVLVLGLPVDVLVTDAELQGGLHGGKLVIEARALRPNLSIVLAGEIEGGIDVAEQVPDAVMLPPGAEDSLYAARVREALAART